MVINKSDLISNKKRLKKKIAYLKKNKHKKVDHVFVSIKKKSNLNILIYKIKKKLKKEFIKTDDILITRQRHRENLEQCYSHLKNFQNKDLNGDFDKAAEDLRLATRNLGVIVGKVGIEEILDSVFNDFCIGK